MAAAAKWVPMLGRSNNKGEALGRGGNSRKLLS